MTERDALLRAVCEHPDDDTPRLVFADWLDEHGEPERAEFIRASVEAGKEEHFFDHSGHNKAAARAKELEKQFGKKWLKEVPAAAGVTWMWKRGFPGWLRAGTWQPIGRLAPKVVGRWPVEHIELDRLTSAGATALAADPFGGRIRYLRIHWFRDMPSLHRLFNSPFMRHVTHLCLRHCFLDDSGAWFVANGTSLRGLKYLDLTSCGMGDLGIRLICDSPHLRKLDYLDVSRNRFESKELEKRLDKRFKSVDY